MDENKDGKISLGEFSTWWKGGRQGKTANMKRLSALSAKAIGLIKSANLELLRELEATPQFVEGGFCVSVGEV